ncbi:MAG: hypothetical protein IJM20_04165 [Clostridia bacterium]|nr:hypothetical protein [Clostridia bacterium]
MRRNIEEIKSEIMRRKDEYKAKKIRFWRTMGISAASGLAALALVFFLTTRPIPGKNVDVNAEGGSSVKPESVGADYQSENSGTHGGPASITAQPEGAPAESTDGRIDPESPGPWICGTPELEGEELSFGGLQDCGATYDGQTQISLTRTMVVFAGDEVRRFAFEGEEGRPVLELITAALREAGAQEAPVEPELLDCEFVTIFDFVDAEGSLWHARVGFTADGYMLFNNEYCMPTLSQQEIAELRTALEALCR